MKKGKKLLSLLLVLVLAFALCGGALAEEAPVAAPAGELDGQIVILHTNDVHGAIEGYAKIAALKAEYEAKGATVFLFDAGDYIQGETSVSTSQGATAIELMNMAGYDVATIGNHEFDYGYANLKTILEAAEFSVVAANVQYNGALAFEATKVIDLPDGKKLGVFGLDTPETATKAHPGKIQGVTFLAGTELFTCAKTVVDELTAVGCDYIICLGHLGIDEESEGNRSVDLLAEVSGIDVFIDGHSHSSQADIVEATNADSTVNGTYLVSAGTKAATVGVITINGEEISISSVDLETYEGSDEAVAARAAEILAEIEAEYGATFATTEVLLNGERAPGNRTEETNLGDLITDAILWYATKDGDDLGVPAANVVALTNGGGIRATIEAGDITKNDINTVLPFGNTVAYVTVSGEVLLEALEASTYCTPTAVGAFPQVAGMEITVDTTVAFDQGEQYAGSTYYGPASINRVTIDSINGRDFDPEATYVVVTNDFLAAGGDTYYAFSVSNTVDTGTPMDVALMDYITEELGGVVTAEKYGEPQGRITIVPNPFADVDSGAWYFTNVMNVYKRGIMEGTGETAFSPTANLTRGQLVTMLYRMEGEPAVEGAVSEVFTDCTDGAYYDKAVLWASQNDIVNGVTETTFNPGGALTRQQMAKILYGYALLKGAEEVTEPTLVYADAEAVADWAVAGVAYCYAEELMRGVTDTTFNPGGTATRAQGAKVLDILSTPAA